MCVRARLTFFNWFIGLTALSLAAWADEANEQRMLAETLPKDNVIWLELSTGSSDASKSLAIYRRAAEKNSKGSVIVLKNSVGNGSIHAALLEDLAEGLPKEGWHTLLVFMPPAADASGQKRLEAALAFLQKGDAKNVVLVVAGKTAPLLSPLFSAKPDDKPFQKIVLLNTTNTEGEFKQYFMEVLNPGVAILDVLLGAQTVDSVQYLAREQRAIMAKQRKFARYEKVNTPKPTMQITTQDNWAFKRIRGWLDKL